MTAETFILVSLIWFSIKASITTWCLIVEDNYYPRKIEVGPRWVTFKLLINMGFIVWLGLLAAKVV